MGRLNALQPVMNVDSEAITNDLGQLAKREGERVGWWYGGPEVQLSKGRLPPPLSSIQKYFYYISFISKKLLQVTPDLPEVRGYTKFI